MTLSPGQLLEHYDRGLAWFGGSGMTLAAAYDNALAVRALRVARGERPVGYKIGFTNRNIWPRYGVWAPIWGTVWDTTLQFCDGRGTLALAGTCEPRIEPEAVFGIGTTPPPEASLEDLFDCIEWVAPGFEIVQSHMPGWKFEAPDTVADQGLHAQLLVGARIPAVQVARDAAAFEQRLAQARVTLLRAGTSMESGVGANVLDGPLHALFHFVRELRACPGAPDLQAGDVVTTGTWTDAWSVAPGEIWAARFGEPLLPLEVRFT